LVEGTVPVDNTLGTCWIWQQEFFFRLLMSLC